MNALFRKGLLLVLFGGLVLAGVSLCLILTAERVVAEDCTVDCTNCSADPVFIQRDYRDMEGLLAARAARAEARSTETSARDPGEVEPK